VSKSIEDISQLQLIFEHLIISGNDSGIVTLESSHSGRKDDDPWCKYFQLVN